MDAMVQVQALAIYLLAGFYRKVALQVSGEDVLVACMSAPL